MKGISIGFRSGEYFHSGFMLPYAERFIQDPSGLSMGKAGVIRDQTCLVEIGLPQKGTGANHR